LSCAEFCPTLGTLSPRHEFFGARLPELPALSASP